MQHLDKIKLLKNIEFRNINFIKICKALALACDFPLLFIFE